MAKSRSHGAEEDVRGDNRNLRKQVKNLRKEVNTLQKKLSKYEGMIDNFSTDPEENYTKKEDNTCVDCGKGDRIISNLGVFSLVTCTQCSYRKKIKK